MTATDVIQLALAVAGVVVFVTLAYRRARYLGTTTANPRRLVLADMVLVIASVEILADIVAGLPLGEASNVMSAVALLARGAFFAGGFALLVTLPTKAWR